MISVARCLADLRFDYAVFEAADMLLHHTQNQCPAEFTPASQADSPRAAAVPSASKRSSDERGPLSMSPAAKSLLQAYAAGSRAPDTAAEALVAFGLIYGCSDKWMPRELHRLALSAALPVAAAAQQLKIPDLRPGDSTDAALHPVRLVAGCFCLSCFRVSCHGAYDL